MRLIILGLVIFTLDLYAFQAFRILSTHWPAAAKAILYSFFWAIPVFTLLFIAAYSGGLLEGLSKNALVFTRTFLFILYLSKILIVPLLMVDDVRRLATMAYHGLAGDQPFDPSRSRFLSQMGIMLGSIPFLTLTYGVLRNAYRYRLFKHRIALPDLPAGLEGLRIVQISDIHSGSFTFKDPVRQAIDLINAQQPDLVFFTGDLVNSRADEMDPFVEVFDKIEARYGVYSVLGNHDYGDYHAWPSEAAKADNFQKLLATHRRLGWRLLMNESEVVPVGEHRVAVIGVENYSAHPRFPKYGDLQAATAELPDAHLKLLLSHDPTHWRDQVVRDHPDIAITFSGHTHGMQFGFEIPGWIKWSPIKYVYKEWAGLYREGRQYLHVNRGLGFLGYPGRVGILPEVTLLELTSA